MRLSGLQNNNYYYLNFVTESIVNEHNMAVEDKYGG